MMSVRCCRGAVSLLCLCIYFCLPSLLIGGCAGGGSGINPVAIAEPLAAVADRHDAYVQADPALSQVERDTYLRSTAILRDVHTEALRRGRADQVRGR